MSPIPIEEDEGEPFKVRIGKVTFKDPKLRQLTLIPNQDLDTTNFIWTLVWLLELARAGRVLAYMGGVIVDEGHSIKELEFGSAAYPGDRLALVGLMEGCKERLLREIREDIGTITTSHPAA